MERTIDRVADGARAGFAPMSGTRVDADYYTALPQKPRDQWPARKGRAMPVSTGAELQPAEHAPCPESVCDGSGWRVVSVSSVGTKKYAICPCKGGKAA